ncbi:hypothetical protein RB195_025140 [Necator americanus]|uniref:Uncharacterized protein n=1 Tax=Necator americanus TaxID=51031 RepID=A0ABR1ELP8_NECAM
MWQICEGYRLEDGAGQRSLSAIANNIQCAWELLTLGRIPEGVVKWQTVSENAVLTYAAYRRLAGKAPNQGNQAMATSSCTTAHQIAMASVSY